MWFKSKELKLHCNSCKVSKPANQFNKSTQAKVFGYKRTCKECESKKEEK